MSKTPSKQYLSSVEIPLQFVWNIQDNNNYAWMVKDANHSEVDHSPESIEAYRQINRDVLNKYDTTPAHKKLLKKKKKMLIMFCEAYEGDEIDKYKEWQAQRLQAEIAKEEIPDDSYRRENGLIIVGKFVYGRMISAMEITYDFYHANLELANNQIKMENALNEKAKRKR